MRKIELARRIAEDTELTYAKAEEAVDAILDEIKVPEIRVRLTFSIRR
jgi:nucleoid DNA-binding protein